MKKVYHRIPEKVEAMKLEDTDASIIEAFEWLNNEDTSDDEKEREDVVSFIRSHKEIEYFDDNGVNKVPFGWFIVKTSEGKIESYNPEMFNKKFSI